MKRIGRVIPVKLWNKLYEKKLGRIIQKKLWKERYGNKDKKLK
jgi:hypothetical protein